MRLDLIVGSVSTSPQPKDICILKLNKKYSMDQISFSITSVHSAIRITRHLQNANIDLHYHRTPPLVRVLSQVNPCHTAVFRLTKIHFNINVMSHQTAFSMPFFLVKCVHFFLFQTYTHNVSFSFIFVMFVPCPIDMFTDLSLNTSYSIYAKHGRTIQKCV